MSASDFPAEQVAEWISVGGGAIEDAPARVVEAAKGDWFVAYTNPRREADVVRACQRRRLQAYMPAMTVTRRRADVSRPLFPRYVFIGLPADTALYALRETPGLESIVRMGVEPVRLEAGRVEALLAQECDGVFDFTAGRLAAMEAARAEAANAAKLARLKPGMLTRIVAGPWQGFSGVVEKPLPPDRVSVFMKLFGRPWAMPMRLADVDPS